MRLLVVPSSSTPLLATQLVVARFVFCCKVQFAHMEGQVTLMLLPVRLILSA